MGTKTGGEDLPQYPLIQPFSHGEKGDRFRIQAKEIRLLIRKSGTTRRAAPSKLLGIKARRKQFSVRFSLQSNSKRSSQTGRPAGSAYDERGMRPKQSS